MHPDSYLLDQHAEWGFDDLYLSSVASGCSPTNRVNAICRTLFTPQLCDTSVKDIQANHILMCRRPVAVVVKLLWSHATCHIALPSLPSLPPNAESDSTMKSLVSKNIIGSGKKPLGTPNAFTRWESEFPHPPPDATACGESASSYAPLTPAVSPMIDVFWVTNNSYMLQEVAQGWSVLYPVVTSNAQWPIFATPKTHDRSRNTPDTRSFVGSSIPEATQKHNRVLCNELVTMRTSDDMHISSEAPESEGYTENKTGYSSDTNVVELLRIRSSQIDKTADPCESYNPIQLPSSPLLSQVTAPEVPADHSELGLGLKTGNSDIITPRAYRTWESEDFPTGLARPKTVGSHASLDEGFSTASTSRIVMRGDHLPARGRFCSSAPQTQPLFDVNSSNAVIHTPTSPSCSSRSSRCPSGPSACSGITPTCHASYPSAENLEPTNTITNAPVPRGTTIKPSKDASISAKISRSVQLRGSNLSYLTAKRIRGARLCGRDCSAKFHDLFKFAVHLDAEHGERYRPYKCVEPQCPWSVLGFHDKIQMARHLRNTHAHANTKYICELGRCKKKFSRLDSYRRHFENTHKNTA